MSDPTTNYDHPVTRRVFDFLFGWPSVILTCAPLAGAGYLARHGHGIFAVLIGLAWLAALIWLTLWLGKRSERDALGIFLAGMLMGGFFFIMGMT